MITFTKLGHHGQLGNQLFQYAMMIGVSEKKGYKICIPYRFTKAKKRGQVELKPFRITADPVAPRIANRFKPTYVEKGFNFDPGVFEQSNGTNYEGYYQTEKYFEHCSDRVRSEYRMQTVFEEFGAEYIRAVRKTDTVVAVHVRRGDYLIQPKLFQILTPEYYKRAMTHPELPLEKQFLVFSDDIEWCRHNLIGLTKEHIDFAESPSHWHDLATMTYCDAHIISASSFSWWGAWLCHNRPNTVIAPVPWFPPGRRDDWDTSDVIPERWYKLQV